MLLNIRAVKDGDVITTNFKARGDEVGWARIAAYIIERARTGAVITVTRVDDTSVPDIRGRDQ